ncbi:MAG TPA: hypothetical protein VF174_07170 [Micromonosporaceae bacterium]
MAKTPRRFGRTANRAWPRWAIAIDNPDGIQQRPAAGRWRRLARRVLLGLGMTTAAVAVLRRVRHRHDDPEPSRRIEFVDVDRPVRRR